MSDGALHRRAPLRLATAGVVVADDGGVDWRAALTIAAESAASELADSRDGGWPLIELRAGTSILAAAAASTLHGLGSGVPQGFPPALPGARLIGAMRRSLLRQVRNATLPDSDAVRVFGALEELSQRMDENAAHRFASKIGGLDGLSLIVDVAHDMRSPLGSILFLAEQIRRGASGEVTAIQERQLGLIYGAALGLSGLASDVMDLARGGETLVQQEMRAFAIPNIYQQVQDIVRPMAEERGISLRFATTVLDARIGHGQALHRVLLNLVTNALKFTTEGEVCVSATATSATRVKFEVRDTGRGIPSAVQATLFDAFRRRVGPGDYIFSSAGLGLSICQSLVRAMESELLVESTENVGSRFEFELSLPRQTLFAETART